MLDRLPRSLALIVLVGVLIAAPTLAAGLLLDDVLVRMRLTGAQTAWGEVAWWELYTFARPDLNADLRAAGFHPWWSDLAVQMRFFRPLSAATHLLDYQLWPDQPALHHLHSLAWYALSIFTDPGLEVRLTRYDEDLQELNTFTDPNDQVKRLVSLQQYSSDPASQ